MLQKNMQFYCTYLIWQLKTQKDLELQRLGLMRDAWKDLIRPQIALKREHLTEENAQLSEAMFRKAEPPRVSWRPVGLSQAATVVA